MYLYVFPKKSTSNLFFKKYRGTGYKLNIFLDQKLLNIKLNYKYLRPF
uniref:Uncharacterized protein n=1 Tax=Lepeophtheirus salmonis TaxID=72036 RepID=A0A0K2V8F2_LEPSM